MLLLIILIPFIVSAIKARYLVCKRYKLFHWQNGITNLHQQPICLSLWQAHTLQLLFCAGMYLINSVQVSIRQLCQHWTKIIARILAYKGFKELINFWIDPGLINWAIWVPFEQSRGGCWRLHGLQYLYPLWEEQCRQWWKEDIGMGSPELPTAVIVRVSTTGIGGEVAAGGSEWMRSLPGGWITECGEAVK